MRVVSLLPSATEIVYALGAEPVATSHECDWPPEAAEKPAVNRSRVDPEADAADVNEQVADAEATGGVYEIDDAALREADPDLVISQGVCDVCAVDSVLVRGAVDRLGLDCEVLTTDPHSLGDVFDDVERVGRALGREEQAREVVAELRERVRAVERVAERSEAERSEASERPSGRIAPARQRDHVMASSVVPPAPRAVRAAAKPPRADGERCEP